MNVHDESRVNEGQLQPAILKTFFFQTLNTLHKITKTGQPKLRTNYLLDGDRTSTGAKKKSVDVLFAL